MGGFLGALRWESRDFPGIQRVLRGALLACSRYLQGSLGVLRTSRGSRGYARGAERACKGYTRVTIGVLWALGEYYDFSQEALTGTEGTHGYGGYSGDSGGCGVYSRAYTRSRAHSSSLSVTRDAQILTDAHARMHLGPLLASLSLRRRNV